VKQVRCKVAARPDHQSDLLVNNKHKNTSAVCHVRQATGTGFNEDHVWVVAGSYRAAFIG